MNSGCCGRSVESALELESFACRHVRLRPVRERQVVARLDTDQGAAFLLAAVQGLLPDFEGNRTAKTKLLACDGPVRHFDIVIDVGKDEANKLIVIL